MGCEAQRQAPSWPQLRRRSRRTHTRSPGHVGHHEAAYHGTLAEKFKACRDHIPDHDRLLLYVILTSPEREWLVWWHTPSIGDNSDPTKAAKGDHVEPYAIRATQSHSGMDVQLLLMHKQITLFSFIELFERTSMWRHRTIGDKLQSILQDGLRPGGYPDATVLARVEAENRKPVSFGVHIGGEFDQLPYPQREYTGMRPCGNLVLGQSMSGQRQAKRKP